MPVSLEDAKSVLFNLGVPVENKLTGITEHEVQPGRYGKVVSRGSFFDFYNVHELSNKQTGQPEKKELVVGYGKHEHSKYLGMRTDTEEFARKCQRDYDDLQGIYPQEKFPHLLPEQSIAMGDDPFKHEPTVVCLRERFNPKKTLASIEPGDFESQPDLRSELQEFRSATAQELRRNGRICDIKNPDNLVVDQDGHLRLLDTNTFFHRPTSGKHVRGDVNYRVATRRLRAIGRVLDEEVPFSRAYDEECKIELKH